MSSNSLTNDENIAHRPIISNYIFIKLAVSVSLRLAFATTKISLGFPHETCLLYEDEIKKKFSKYLNSQLLPNWTSNIKSIAR